jgi:Prokaryotic Cytochrome C oxidase subunit IV
VEGHRGEILAALAALVVATGLELALARAPGLPRAGVIAGLVALAFSKAAIIALVLMRLRRETRALRLTVFGPLAAPFVYALVLMADSAWRHLP